MKDKGTYKVTTEDGRIVCGTVRVESISRFRINEETFLFCDMENIERILPYSKKNVTGRHGKIGVPGVSK